MASVRLSQELEQKLETLSQKKRKSKSDLIKMALEQFFKAEESEQDSYEIGKSLFGVFASGNANLSTEYKSKLRDKIRAKRSSC